MQLRIQLVVLSLVVAALVVLHCDAHSRPRSLEYEGEEDIVFSPRHGRSRGGYRGGRGRDDSALGPNAITVIMRLGKIFFDEHCRARLSCDMGAVFRFLKPLFDLKPELLGKAESFKYAAAVIVGINKGPAGCAETYGDYCEST